jgi:hypothetical protein
MSEHKSRKAMPPNQAVVSRSFGMEGAVLESVPFAMLSDSNIAEENRQPKGIKASAHSVQIIKQLIEYIKKL